MAEWIRVKDEKTGHEYTAAKGKVTSQDGKAVPGIRILEDRKAVGSDGKPLPPKHNVNTKKTATSAA